jgi:hypothetical protein
MSFDFDPHLAAFFIQKRASGSDFRNQNKNSDHFLRNFLWKSHFGKKRKMNSNKKSLILFILFVWSVYLAWATEVQSEIKSFPNSTDRYDFLLLPFLIIFTGYAVYLLFRKQKTDNT